MIADWQRFIHRNWQLVHDRDLGLLILARAARRRGNYWRYS